MDFRGLQTQITERIESQEASSHPSGVRHGSGQTLPQLTKKSDSLTPELMGERTEIQGFSSDYGFIDL
jgi:hypothetical protein